MARRMMTDGPSDTTQAPSAPTESKEYTRTSPARAALDVRRVTVSWGKELFSPVKYESFEVGPFSIEVEIKPGDDVEQIMADAHQRLADFAEKVRASKRATFARSITSRAKD